MKDLTVFSDDLGVESEDFSLAFETSASGSTGILLSTLWSQSGVLMIGTNKTVTCNEYTPLDSNTGTHSKTGCTNTAAAQIIYYFIENFGLDPSLVLTVEDEFTSSYNGSTVNIKANGSTRGTISFAAVNAYLGDYELNSAEHAAALLYACGVVQKAAYSSTSTSTSWKADLFYRTGFRAVINATGGEGGSYYYWGSKDADGKFRISEGGFEVIIENLLAGRPVGTSLPGHALVIDGYDADNDLFHINYGWGNSTSTRWYSREEMHEDGYYHFIYDLLLEPFPTLTVSDSRIYGTGTMLRAFEQAAADKGANTVVFDAAVAGATLELPNYITLQDEIAVRGFYMSLLVTAGNGYGFYGNTSASAAFDNFNGALVVDTDGNSCNLNHAFHFAYAQSFSLNTSNALIFAGSYTVDGDYSLGAAAVLAALESAQKNDSDVDTSLISAASVAFCATVNNDVIRFTDRTVTVGECYLRSGDDMLSIDGRSRLYGPVYSDDGADVVSVTNGSLLEGDLSLGSGNNSITVDSTSSIKGCIYDNAALAIVLNSAPADRAIYTVTRNCYHYFYAKTVITVDVSDADLGTYTLIAADPDAYNKYALEWIVITVTGTAAGDYTLSCDGTSTSQYADLIYEDSALKLRVKEIPSSRLPNVVSVEADVTAPTNQNVTVSAVFNRWTVTRQYSLDGSNWQTYPGDGVVMTANGVVYFRGVNAEGNISEVTSYEVVNIDKIPPEKPAVSADITAPTNQNVTVSAVFSADSKLRQYSLDGGSNWRTYTDGVVMRANGVVYFRGIDAAGNISEVTSYSVANIDKSVPDIPRVSADIAAMTGDAVVVAAEFSEDSIVREYSLDGGAWRAYTGALAVSSAGTLRFRGINSVGTVSEIAEYVVEYGRSVANSTYRISSGSAANSTSVTGSGSAYISSGAVMHRTTVDSSGHLYVLSGGSAHRTAVESGQFSIWDSGVANLTVVDSGGEAFVRNGGAMYRTVIGGGYLHIASGGTANSTTVNSGGEVYVASGGTVNSADIDIGGYMVIVSGGSAVAIRENGGYVYVGEGAITAFADNSFSNVSLGDRQSATVHSGTTANSTTVNSGGSLIVYRSGTANATIVNSSGYLRLSGGTANSATVNSGGCMYVFSGGSANYTTFNSGGNLNVYSGGVVSRSVVFSGGRIQLAGGQALDAAVSNGGGLYVRSYGGSDLSYASNAQIYSGGFMDVYDSSTTEGTVIHEGGYVRIRDFGVASNTLIESGASMYVHSTSGLAVDTVVSGFARVYDGAVMSRTSIASGASFHLWRGGIMKDAEVQYGGLLDIRESAPVLTGDIRVAGQLKASYDQNINASGARIILDLTGRTEADAYSIVNLDYLGETNLRIAVSANQASGTYKLASRAAGFAGTLTLGTDGANYGTITVNGDALNYRNYTYLLTASNSNLLLTVSRTEDTIAPVITSVTQNDYSGAAANVVLTIHAEDEGGSGVDPAGYKYWDANAGLWANLPGNTLTVSQNGDHTFAVYDMTGNVSALFTHTVTNIDRTAPVITSVTQDDCSGTVANVVLTIHAEDGGGSGVDPAGYKYWDANAGLWADLPGNTLTVSQNGDHTFAVYDKAGNVSALFTHTVTSIDRTAPVITSVTQDDYSGTAANVVLTIHAEDEGGSGVDPTGYKYWDAGKGFWADLPGNTVMVPQGGSYTFAVYDKIGNVSALYTHTIEIDRTAPAITSVSQDKYFMSGSGITLTINAVDEGGSGVDPTGYKYWNPDAWLWADLPGNTLTVTQPGNYTFAVYDKAGNVSGLFTHTIEIERTTPVIMSVDQDRYSLDGAGITLTINAVDEGGSGVDPAGYKYWDANAGLWADLPGNTITVAGQAGSHTFAVYDKAGNVSGLYTHTIEIDRTAPVITSVTQDRYRLDGSGITLTIHAVDEGGSGVDPTGYKYWDANAGLWADLPDNTITVAGQAGSHTFAVYDKAGNVSSLYTHSVIDDHDAPVITSVTQNDCSGTAANVVLTIHAADEGSGVDPTGYKYWDGNAGLWADLPDNTLTVSQNGDYTFAVYDNAGNVSVLYTHTVSNIIKPASAAAAQNSLAGEEITGWVGFGDAADFIKFQLAGDGQVQLDLDGATAAAFNAGQAGLTCLDADGKEVELAAFDGDTLVSKQAVAAGEYYLGVTCADVKKFETSYSITVGPLFAA